jgi:Bifunctional DNA primase/polymerase, N-terminal/Primase C terminal 1 (PriCT-1)
VTPDTISRLAVEGCRLFPVAAREKTPLIPDWPNQASDRSENIDFWSKRWPGSNWGVATGAGSGTFVIDFDGDAGRRAIEYFTGAYSEDWLRTRTAKTPRGRHLWYVWPDGETRIRNSAGKIAYGVDVRGEGGYVVVPPSVHPSGAPYTWENFGAIASAPVWLLDLVIHASGQAEPKFSIGGNGTNGSKEAIIPRGQRNSTLASLAGSMRRRGMEQDAIFAALSAHNTAHCDPPLSEGELRTIANSVSRYEATDQPIIAKTIDTTVRQDMPDAVLDGRLGEICKRRLSSLPIAYSWLPLIAAAGPLITRETSIRNNIFVCTVGPKGSGKSTGYEHAFRITGILEPVLVPAMFGSAEALVERLQGQSCCLLSVDELAHLLAKAAIDRSSFPFVLNRAFYADRIVGGSKGQPWEIDCRISLAGGIVEELFGDAFGYSSTGGLHDRFLFGLCPQPYEHLWRPFEGWSEELKPLPSRVHPNVWDAKDEWIKSGIPSRVAELCLRVAYIAACIDRRSALSASDLSPALALARYEVKLRAYLAPNPGENSDARCAVKIRAWLADNASDGAWVRRRDLDRGINAARFGPNVFNRCLLAMQFGDEIELDKPGKNLRLII